MLTKIKTKEATPVALDTNDQAIIYYSKRVGPECLKLDNLEPFPSGDNVCYVVGRRGSGKSTFCSIYIKNYVASTDKKVFFISRFEEDPSIVLPERSMRIPLNQLEEVDIYDFENSLVVFDDIANSTLTRGQVKQLHNFILDLIENSRHINTSVLITSHLCTNYGKTREILNESNTLVVFPQYSNRYFIEKCLKTYYGLTKEQINNVMDSRSRWVIVNTIHPKFIMDSKSISLYQ